MENIIIAICLRVDKAIIFFKSCSQLADILAYKAVIDEISINIIIIYGCDVDEIRIIKYTPAVTKVDEWTKAEIGVGADIAIGNQAENGNCALFVHLANSNIKIIILENISFENNSQDDSNIIIPIVSKINTSPIRFLKRVIDPDPEDELFW